MPDLPVAEFPPSRRFRLPEQIFAVPAGADRYLVYAPLHGIAFVANGALVEQVRRRAEAPEQAMNGRAATAGGEAREEDPASLLAGLERLGLFREAAPPPDDPAAAAGGYDTAVLFLTNRCNLRCVYCYADGGELPAEDMPWPLARAAVDRVLADVVRHGRPGMTLAFHGGGEPSLNWPVLTRAVARARAGADRLGVPLQVTGAFNGCWTARVRDYILRNFTELSISFDGTPAVQDAQRPGAGGRGSYRRAARTLEALDAAGFRYGVRLTVTRGSVASLAESVAHIAARFRPHTIQAEPAFATGRARRSPAALDEPDEFLRQFAAARDVAAARGIRLFYSGARPELLTRRFCLAPCRALVVTPAGDVSACFEVYGRRHPLSRAFLVGRWDGAGDFRLDPAAARRHRRRSVLQARACDGCFCRWHCAGDCAVKEGERQRRLPAGELPLRCRVNQELTKFLVLKEIQANGGRAWIRGGAPTATEDRCRPGGPAEPGISPEFT